MSQIKKLAKQTVLYGLSNIMAKMLNYLLTPLLSYLLIGHSGQIANGNLAIIYASMTFINILFTYGMETTYFRFSNDEKINRKNLFQTSMFSLILSTLFFTIILIIFKNAVAQLMVLEQAYYVNLMVLIIAVDTISIIPFAKLRQEEKPLKYAMVKVLGILITIALTVWFIVYSPAYIHNNPQTIYSHYLADYSTTALLLMANLFGSFFTFLLLIKEWQIFRFRFDFPLWKKLMKYSLPFVIIGLGGMINEVIDRIMLSRLFSGTIIEAKAATATYNFSYKLAIFITLFIQAFKMAAEPFFFSKSTQKDAKEVYAKVMHWFVITLCIAFLFTALFLDAFKYFIGPEYRSGIYVVPILLAANVCLGIYYNLAVWYKVTDKLNYGIGITLFGAGLTLLINFYFIPVYGMQACAWATLICYASMMLLSYYFGQLHYPIPYHLKSIGFYVLMGAICFMVQQTTNHFTSNLMVRLSCGLILFFAYLILVKSKEGIKFSYLKRRSQ